MDLSYADYLWDMGALRQRDLTVQQVYDRNYLAERYVDIDDKVRELSEKRLEFLERFAPQGWEAGGYVRGRLLDFGCGTGRFVEAARAAGWDAFGYDLVSPFERMPCGPWDVVTFFDSLEHLPDPAGTIRNLNPEWIMISVPECCHPTDPDWFLAWKHRRPGEHLWHFSQQGLDQFMFGCGYRGVEYSHLEDTYRPPENCNPNILTAIYRKARTSLDMPTLSRLGARSGYTNHSLGWLLYSVALANFRQAAVEIGYNRGYSASWICAAVKDHGKAPVKMVSVDIRPCDKGHALQAQGFDFHHFLQAPGPESAGQALKILDRPVDFLFIDGDHENPLADFLAYRDFLADDAMVLFHDSYHPPIQEAMRQTGLIFVDLGGCGSLALGRKNHTPAFFKALDSI